ncbi:SGNH/GDSL hydrolase family protein [Streptomyces acidiscabies]|uniref:GDSL family lipase n=1 Tax=Streptomyces acidiscabies TaxID=42234 RepID=A0A0L0KNN3_9ACTN|nr:SGNH/GDSL hydrolase family protein [Streptomyces acidiscabies]KND39481.1 GDSL family lipase [Streptomyces acidiscabies]
MRTRTRLGLAGAFSCAVLVTVVGIGRSGGGGGGGGDEEVVGPYVALGDSYTAGPKIPGQAGVPAGCQRSDRNYPAVVARHLKVPLTDVSCTGATIDDLTAAQNTEDGSNAAQFSALNEETRLVTLGIGGNDIGFATTITECVKLGVRYQMGSLLSSKGDSAPCREKYDAEVGRKIDALGGKLAGALAEVGRRSPDAKVYVVGYPAVFPEQGDSCGRLGLAPGDVAFLREQERRLNSALKKAASGAGASYVDTYKPSEGLGACAGKGVRWIEPLMPAAPAAPVHPNEKGEAGMAAAVLGVVLG